MEIIERIFYKHLMKSGKAYYIRIPQEVTISLGLEDRDELEFKVRKTGRKIAIKPSVFLKKEVKYE